ncbi:alpha/beta hydrolase [Chitinophaga sp.]|uniref:alpha/beta hydrolase n=1 Tax=Chitinophaga sp. TaxID=1869181 RepID=UPI0031D910A8
MRILLILLFISIQGMGQYISKDVQYYNADSSIHFGGTLIVPAGVQSFPAVVLISGTGKQDRDGTMAGHKMFKVIAEYLGSNGIAVLRVDDRGTGTTTGDYEKATTADFAADAITAVTFLKAYPGVKGIGLVGHSEGGAAAYMAAVKSKDVRFMISLAGLATTGLKALQAQNRAIVASAGIPVLMQQRFNAINDIMFDTAYAYAGSPDMESHLRSAYAAWNERDLARGEQDSVYKKSRDHFFFPLESYIMQATGPWYRYNIRFDPTPWLKQVKVPVLAFNGDKDIMVEADENLGNYKKYVKQVKVVKVGGLNHLFQHCVTCTMQEPAKLQEDFAPEVLKEMVSWINGMKIDVNGVQFIK